jgi:hypothetical protein
MSLAAAAALAIDNARLHERSSELSLLANQERIGRDFHDTAIQRIFAIGLAMHGTAQLANIPEMLAAQPELTNRLHRHTDDLDATIREIRSVIFEIDAARPVRSSLRRDVLDLIAESARVLGFDPAVRFDGPIDTLVPPEPGDPPTGGAARGAVQRRSPPPPPPPMGAATRPSPAVVETAFGTSPDGHKISARS